MTVAQVLAGSAPWAIEERDALSIPWSLPDASVATIVTSPPYWGLRDYGTARWIGGSPDCDHRHQLGGEGAASEKQNTSAGTQLIQYRNSCPRCGARRVDRQLGLERDPQEYVARLVEVFREARRVLEHYGTLWLNLGDTYYTAKGSCWNPGGSSMSIHQERVTAGAVPHARDAPNRMMPRSRAAELGLKPKDLCGIPWRVAFALQADGWYLRSDIVWAKPNPMPESVTDRPTRAHEFLFLFSKSSRYFYDVDAIREPVAQGTIDRLSQPGFDAQTGGAKDYRNGVNPGRSLRGAAENMKARLDEYERGRANGRFPRLEHPLGRNARDVWTIPTEPFSDAHFATFPPALVERCVKAGSRPGWIVLDPFAGAGTTVLVADRLGRRGIGFDLKGEYCELARRRIRDDCPLFSGPETQEEPAQAAIGW